MRDWMDKDGTLGGALHNPRLPWILFVGAMALLGIGIFGAASMIANERSNAEALRQADSEMRVKLADAEKNVQTLQEERKELSEEVEKKESELAKMKATFDSLNDKMKAEIMKGDIKLSQSGGKIQVELIDKILFDSGQAELSKRGEEVLMRMGGILAKIEDRQLQVSGHTDDSPPTDKITDRFPTNWELSAARAVNVVRFLAEKAKVPPRRLIAAGYGEYKPVATNANPTGRARNRRIEILLTPVLDAKPSSIRSQVAKVDKNDKGKHPVTASKKK